jgi:hypothetical protein
MYFISGIKMSEEKPLIQPMQEVCGNPFKHKEKCKNTNIKLYIVIKGKQLPICHECWDKIADSNKEWGNDIKPDFSPRELPKEEE